ncbi:MAG TPA: hypothetical protein VF229_00390, partial [Burkholderiaceae bacterium]
MPRWVRGVLVLAASVALGACSLFSSSSGENDAYDYRTAHSKPGTLEVPPDLTPLPRDDRVAVSGGASANAAAASAGAPAAGGAASGTG